MIKLSSVAVIVYKASFSFQLIIAQNVQIWLHKSAARTFYFQLHDLLNFFFVTQRVLNKEREGCVEIRLQMVAATKC